MKKNLIKLSIIVIMLFNLTGCTSYLKDENKKIIQNSSTGQNLPLNILCKPEDQDTLRIYENYNETTKNKKVDLNNLSVWLRINFMYYINSFSCISVYS